MDLFPLCVAAPREVILCLGSEIGMRASLAGQSSDGIWWSTVPWIEASDGHSSLPTWHGDGAAGIVAGEILEHRAHPHSILSRKVGRWEVGD